MTAMVRVGRPFRLWLEGTQAWYDNLADRGSDPLMEAIRTARVRADGSVRIALASGDLERLRFLATCLIDVTDGEGIDGLPERNSAVAAIRSIRSASASA